MDTNTLSVGRRNYQNTNALLEAENKRLRGMNERLQDAITFTGYEWRNQVSRLLIAAEKLLLESDDPLSAKQRQTVQYMQQTAREIQRTAHNYLNLARLNDASFVVRASYVDLKRDIIQPLLETYAEQLEQTGQTVEIDLYSGDALVWADAALLMTVLDNLLHNAIIYGESGGRIIIRFNERGHEDEISVWNSGPGISADIQSCILDRFVSTRCEDVAGIGLYLSAKIVEAHGGRLWVESLPDYWANVVFTLPRRARYGIRN